MTPPRPPAAPSGTASTIIDGVLAVGSAAVLAASLAGWLGAWHWLLDLVSHFRGYLLAAAVLGLGGALLRPRRWTLTLLGAAVAVNAWPMLPFWLPAPPATAAADAVPLELVSLNVHRVNRDTGRTVDYLRKARPDVAVILEPDDAWASALHGLADVFPHRVVEPRPDNFGIAVLSKWPLADHDVVDFGVTGYPAVVARVRFPGREFLLVAAHPHAPISQTHARDNATQLAAIADFAARAALPCIVAGDFNATPWCVVYRRFAAVSGLVDTARGRGVQPTWNARLVAPRIPIDHVFAPPEAVVLRRAVGPDVGSDHLPVEVRLILPGPPPSP